MDFFNSSATLAAATPFLIALSVGLGAWWVGRRRRRRFLGEAALILGAYAVYFAVRSITEGSISVARENARLLIDLERQVGLLVEPSVQQVLLSSDVLVDVANWIYVWGHWPVIGVVAIWLFNKRPSAYRTYRNALLISGAIGLVMFVSFPLAPPRFTTELGLVDTVFGGETLGRLLQPTQLTNEYAAFPSLHFGWSLLMATAIYREAQRQPLRVVAWLLPAGMLVAIIATANHFVLDAVAGGAVAMIGLRAALMLDRRGLPEAVTSRLPGHTRPDAA